MVLRFLGVGIGDSGCLRVCRIKVSVFQIHDRVLETGISRCWGCRVRTKGLGFRLLF